MKTFALAFSALVLAFSSHSEAQGAGRGTSVVYGNGMLNANGEWKNGIREIENLNLDRSFDMLGNVSYDVAINRSEFRDNGFTLDGLEELYQVARQKYGDQGTSKLWIWLAGLEAMPDGLRDDYIRITNNVIANPIVSDPTLTSHVIKYKGYLSTGSRILLVSHSQGNLYANEAWRSLFDGGRNSVFVESFGNVQVATPASSVKAQAIQRLGTPLGTWQTFLDDVVILPVRLSFGALPANLGLGGQVGDLGLGHNFIKAYMRTGSTALASIVADMTNVARVLAYPTGIADLSAASSDSSALADLINDANNLSPTPVEPGKPLYLEGSGLGGAQFVVPGVTARITASAVNLPVDHPLYVAGAEVWKLTIPASAVVGSSGVIRAIINIDGVEQSFASPRAVTIVPSDGTLYRLKSYLRLSASNSFSTQICLEQYRENVEFIEITSGFRAGESYERVTAVQCQTVSGSPQDGAYFINSVPEFGVFYGHTFEVGYLGDAEVLGYPNGQGHRFGQSIFRSTALVGGKCFQTTATQRPFSAFRRHCSPFLNAPDVCDSVGSGWEPWFFAERGGLVYDGAPLPPTTFEIPCSQANDVINSFVNQGNRTTN